MLHHGFQMAFFDGVSGQPLEGGFFRVLSGISSAPRLAKIAFHTE
jgi:hypothetical protein